MKIVSRKKRGNILKKETVKRKNLRKNFKNISTILHFTTLVTYRDYDSMYLHYSSLPIFVNRLDVHLFYFFKAVRIIYNKQTALEMRCNIFILNSY